MGDKGWVCPVCYKGKAPWVEECGCGEVNVAKGDVVAVPSAWPYWKWGSDDFRYNVYFYQDADLDR